MLTTSNEDTMHDRPKVPLSLILKHTASIMNVDVSLVAGRSRLRELVTARHIYCHIAVKKFNYTNRETAFLIGKRNHSTIINGCRSIQNRLDTESSVRAIYAKTVNQIMRDDDLNVVPFQASVPIELVAMFAFALVIDLFSVMKEQLIRSALT